jgi:hypothetical protein
MMMMGLHAKVDGQEPERTNEREERERANKTSSLA